MLICLIFLGFLLVSELIEGGLHNSDVLAELPSSGWQPWLACKRDLRLGFDMDVLFNMTALYCKPEIKQASAGGCNLGNASNCSVANVAEIAV